MGMELKNQVCSLELAKRLKELGIPQISQFVWLEDQSAHDTTTGESVIRLYWKTDTSAVNEGGGDISQQDFSLLKKWSAFTVAELGELIPRKVERPGGNTTDGTYNFYTGKEVVEADTEADARAKMLIYLIENKLITPTQ